MGLFISSESPSVLSIQFTCDNPGPAPGGGWLQVQETGDIRRRVKRKL